MNNTFNDANQLTDDGTETFDYDDNGNLWKTNSVVSHTWDRANRLLSVGNHSYKYDGNSARIQKTVSSVVTDYLLDVNQGLTQVLAESDGTNTQSYIHSPRGIHAMNDGSNWSYMLQDGLGSVRAEIGANVAVNGSQSYAPYGEVFGASGSFASPYGITESKRMVMVRFIYEPDTIYPSIGVFNALDPFEGSVGRPMSLNGYSWVEGNPINLVDYSGKQAKHPDSGCLLNDISSIRSLLRIGRLGADKRYPITQSSCGNTAGAHPPFGCNRGTTIPYALVRGFAQGNYSIGATACPSWQGTDFPEHHCGLDFVSYSDGGLAWNEFREGGDRKIRIRNTETGNVDIYDIDAGLKGSGDSAECLSPDQFENGQFQAQFIGPADDLSGRKVYALFDGEVKGWSSSDATLSVKLAVGTKDTSLEMQYTHLIPCDGANPATISGKVTKGQHIGCYARVGATSTPHLHIGFVQRDTDGSRLTATEINNRLCSPEDIYLNPSVRNFKYGYGGFVTGSGQSTLPHYLRFGYSSVPIAGTDWSTALP